MAELVETLRQLIEFESISPQDEGCQDYMIEFLQQHGFTCQRFNNAPVSNFFAQFGNSAPLLVFAGHTDVVPAGVLEKWNTPPFQLIEQTGCLYGRGVADMKGSLAAMLHMAARFVQDYPCFSGSLGFLITSGEEGNDFDLGTPYVMERLQEQGIHIDYCIVGEPSSTQTVGDTVKIGRRGSLSGNLTLQGKQGHVAYPHLAVNPIHEISLALAELTHIQWDKGNAHFPPTSFQITAIQAGGEATNIIPGELNLQFNFRFSTEQDVKELQKQTLECFSKYGLVPQITWRLNGLPFLTSHGRLLTACSQVIEKAAGVNPELSTSGGTSDGRFIAPYGVEVIELGLVNATIHQINECISVADLYKLETIYYEICKELLVT